MTLQRVPPVGTRVVFEGHEYIIIAQRRGRSVMKPVAPTDATFKKVTCASADLTPTVQGEYQRMVERDADSLATFYAHNTAAQADVRGYADHLVRKLRRKYASNGHPPCVLPFRHLIRTRHCADQRDKGE